MFIVWSKRSKFKVSWELDSKITSAAQSTVMIDLACCHNNLSKLTPTANPVGKVTSMNFVDMIRPLGLITFCRYRVVAF